MDRLRHNRADTRYLRYLDIDFNIERETVGCRVRYSEGPLVDSPNSLRH